MAQQILDALHRKHLSSNNNKIEQYQLAVSSNSYELQDIRDVRTQKVSVVSRPSNRLVADGTVDQKIKIDMLLSTRSTGSQLILGRQVYLVTWIFVVPHR